MAAESSSTPRTVVRYGFAVLVSGAAMLARVVLAHTVGPGLPTYLTFYPAVMLAATLWGGGAGLVATAASALAASYWVLPSVGQLAIANPVDAAGLALFLLMSGGMSWVAELFHRARSRVATQTQDLARQAEQLQVAAETARQQAEVALGQRERQLATLLANLPGIAYRCRNDRDWTMEFLSEGCEALTGYPAAAFLHNAPRSFNDLILPEDREAVRAAVQTALADRRPYQLTYRLQTAQGAIRWVWEQGRGIFGEEGTALALEGFITDITERARAEAALQESERRYRELAALLPEAVFEVDSQGTLGFVNQQAFTVFRYTPEDLAQGFNIFTTIAPAEQARARVNMERVLRGERPEDHEYLLLRKDGTTFPALIYTAPILRDGRPVGLRGFLVDISARKQVETALTLCTQQLTAVREVSTELTRELDLTHLLRLIVEQAARLMRATSGTCFLWEEASRQLVPQAWIGYDDWRGRTPHSLESGLAGQVALRREGVVTTNYPAEPYADLRVTGRKQISAVMGEPLLYHERLIGVVTLDYDYPREAFTQDERDLLRVFATQAAIAIENARLFSSAVEHRDRLLALVRAIGSVTAGLDLQATLEHILHAAAEIARCPHVRLLLVDAATQTLRIPVTRGLTGPDGPLPLGTGLSGIVAATGQPLFVPDTQADPRNLFPEFDRQVGLRTYLGLPIVLRGEVLGVLTFRTAEARTYTAEEIEYYGLYAHQTAIAIENARLYEATQRELAERKSTEEALAVRTRQLDAIRVVGVEITQELDLERVLTLIAQQAVALVGADSDSFWLWDAASQALLPKAWHGQGDWMVGRRLRLGEGIAGTVALQRVGVMDNAYRTSAYAQPVVLAHTTLTASLAEPLLFQDRLLGVIVLDRTAGRPPFQPADQALLRLFAAQAAIALENARLFAELNDSYAQLQTTQAEMVRAEKLRALGQMAAGVAHDLNNMLAAILGQVELLRLRVKLPEIQEALQVLYTAASDGAQVVRRLQEFGRQQASTRLEPCALAPIVQEALELTRSRWQDEAQRQGRAIEICTALDGLPRILGHPAELREALTNLLLNAVDAMPTGGTLTLAGYPEPTPEEPAGVVLTVTDTGTGMPEEVLRHIFDPFYTTKGIRGTGLGLAVVYSIVERHGGRIAVTSTPGQGTIFTLRFQAAPGGPDAAPSPAPSHVHAPRRILLIDDETPVRTTAAQLLRAIGHTVVETESGAAGLAALAAQAVDLVLTDLGMPEMTGWEVAQRVKATRPHLPVILLTGWGQQISHTTPGQEYVDRVLGKPVRLADLQAAIAELTEP
jgi:PAS domain S-box-containing protein